MSILGSVRVGGAIHCAVRGGERRAGLVEKDAITVLEYNNTASAHVCVVLQCELQCVLQCVLQCMLQCIFQCVLQCKPYRHNHVARGQW